MQLPQERVHIAKHPQSVIYRSIIKDTVKIKERNMKSLHLKKIVIDGKWPRISNASFE